MATTTSEAHTVLLADSLDKLPVQINTVLIQIGKLFKHQAHPEQRVPSRQRTQAHDVIAKATRQFHDALDDVEIEILNARAVLERDINAIKARQAERENAQRAVSTISEPIEVGPAEDLPMQDYPEETNIKIQTPEESLPLEVPVEILDADTKFSEDIQEAQNNDDTQQDLKDLGLGDDLFGESMAGDFGPVDENSSFDLFNDNTGGDFDMDFSMANDATTTTTTAINDASITATVNPNGNGTVDGDLMMQPFADIGTSGEGVSNDFGDIDFGAIDQPQGDVSADDNPFGSHANDEFDDFFNS